MNLLFQNFNPFIHVIHLVFTKICDGIFEAKQSTDRLKVRQLRNFTYLSNNITPEQNRIKQNKPGPVLINNSNM